MDPIVVPSHFGVTSSLILSTVSTIGLCVIQIFLYFTKYRGRGAAPLKGFVVYLWFGVGTVQIVLSGGWIWIAQYWTEYKGILTMFIWGRFVTINAIASSQICLAVEIRIAMKIKGWRLQMLLPAVVIAVTILELVSYIGEFFNSFLTLVVADSEKPVSRAWKPPMLFRRPGAANAATSVAIAGLFLQRHLKLTSDEGFVSPDKLRELAVAWVLNSGLAIALVSVLFLISIVDTASDLEVFSATTFLLVPLHIGVFLAHLSSRVVEAGSKPPALFSGVELTYYRHQGDIADTNAGLECNPFKDSLVESASRATKDAGSEEASRH